MEMGHSVTIARGKDMRLMEVSPLLKDDKEERFEPSLIGFGKAEIGGNRMGFRRIAYQHWRMGY
jgi:hypothetical protein